MSCPICAKKRDEKYRPFCSKRCADIDLGRWFSGRYAVPSDSPEDLQEAAQALAQEDTNQARRPN